MDRRVFLQNTGGVLGGLAVADALSPMLNAAQAARPDLAVVKGQSADKIVRAAVDALGGIRRFISSGDTVVIKPNIGWDRTPEQAANTNPEVVGTLVALCKEAGAKTIKVLDRTCNDPRNCYNRSGIEAAAKAAGAEVILIGGPSITGYEAKYKDKAIPGGVAITSWPLLEDIFEPNVKIINCPVAKHHGSGGLTMCLKNWMGVMGGNRGQVHQKLHTAIVDVASVIKPTLVLVDAIRILTARGPQGGNLEDVKKEDTVIAGVDQVAADAYTASWIIKKHQVRYRQDSPVFEKVEDITHIKEAAERGLGKIDLTKLNIRQIEA
jgi:uncharacterized protein (DUF362 family)